jgi:hypothetical protein
VQWFESTRWWLSPGEPYILISVVTQIGRKWVGLVETRPELRAQQGFPQKSSRQLTLGLLVLDTGLSHV